MTPVSFHPPSPSLPLVNQIEDRDQIFISPNNMDSNSLSCPSFFDILDQQTRDIRELRHDQEDGELVLYGASSSHQVCNSSFISPQPAGTVGGHNLPFYKMGEAGSKSGYGSAKWMSSKMRLMLKTMTPSSPPVTDKVSFQNQEHENSQTSSSVFNNRNSTTRVCADCNTTSTPLWRSGPEGPKSLCNACGIRQRKARRAAATANGEVTSMDTKTTRVHNKQKKLRTNHFVQFKNKWKGTSLAERKIPLKDFAWNSALHHQVFPRDEVAEAALLLMDLSCGFLHI